VSYREIEGPETRTTYRQVEKTMSRLRSFGLLALTLASIGLTAGTSRADISIVNKNDPQPNEVNIHLSGGMTGTTVTGTADTTLGTYIVNFSSTQTLEVVSKGQGQGFIQAINGSGDQVGLTNGSISLASGPTSTFEDFILNLSNGGPFGKATGVTITVNALDANGNPETITPYTDNNLGSGQNYYTIVASGGESIQSISFQTTGGGLDGFDQLQQPRISFAEARAVPEPSTLAVGLAGMLGFGWYTRRRLRLA